ncbi:MAG: transposase [Rivularia sp. (in: cyanobacteria)]
MTHSAILKFTITPGNINDRKPVPDLLNTFFGKVFADRGYVSQKLASLLLAIFWNSVFRLHLVAI